MVLDGRWKDWTQNQGAAFIQVLGEVRMADPAGITKAEVELFEMLWGHLTSLYTDVASLANSKQDGLMS